MTGWKAWLAAAGLFIAGFVAGAAVVFLLVAAHLAPAMALLHGRPDRAMNMVTRRLSRELDLDSAQREKLREVADRTAARIARIQDAHFPEIQAALDDAMHELDPVLHPEQREKLRRHLEEAMRIRKHIREGIEAGP